MKRFVITRWCCTSGMCMDCHSNGGKRRRVVQLDTDNETVAKMCVNGWRGYEAELTDNQKESKS